MSSAGRSSSAHTASAASSVHAAREDRQPFEDALLVVEQQIVAPVDDGAQRLLAGECGAAPAGEEPEPLVESLGDLADGKRARARRRELDREWEPVEALAHVAHRVAFRRR